MYNFKLSIMVLVAMPLVTPSGVEGSLIIIKIYIADPRSLLSSCNP
jgi:hypothetical protein